MKKLRLAGFLSLCIPERRLVAKWLSLLLVSCLRQRSPPEGHGEQLQLIPRCIHTDRKGIGGAEAQREREVAGIYCRAWGQSARRDSAFGHSRSVPKGSPEGALSGPSGTLASSGLL